MVFVALFFCCACFAIKLAAAPIIAAIMVMPIKAIKSSGITIMAFVSLIAPAYKSFPVHEAQIECKPDVLATHLYWKWPSCWVRVLPIIVQGRPLKLAYSVIFSLGTAGMSWPSIMIALFWMAMFGVSSDKKLCVTAVKLAETWPVATLSAPSSVITSAGTSFKLSEHSPTRQPLFQLPPVHSAM